MAKRIGLGKGKGKGYRNIVGKDPHVHSQSAKGIKQPQRLPPHLAILLNTPAKKSRFGGEYESVLVKDEVQRNKWIEATLVNDESSNDNELINYFIKEGNMGKEEAEFYVNQRNNALKNSLNFKLKKYDSDGDGVPNKFDCRPNDPTKQDTDSIALKKEFDEKKETFEFKNYYKEDIKGHFLRLGKHDESNPIVINGYPYGRLRTQIRYWIETTNRGDRFVSQTLNPKIEGHWNKPKKSTYDDVMVMVANNKGHVTYKSLKMNDTQSKAKEFLDKFGDQLSKDQKIRVHRVIGWDKAMKNVKVQVSEARSDFDYEKHKKEQDNNMQEISKQAKYYAIQSHLDNK